MANPEDAVIHAIDGLERDEISELVDWQLEQGRRSGEYLLHRPRQCRDHMAEIERVVQSAGPWVRRYPRVSVPEIRPDGTFGPIFQFPDIDRPNAYQPIDTSMFTDEMRRLGFAPGDRGGWVDGDGIVHVEEVGTGPRRDPIATAGTILSGLIESFTEDSEPDQ